MHYCPDCGLECNCGCDYMSEDDCEHVCETPEEKEHWDDFEDNYNPWDEEEEYIYDEE